MNIGKLGENIASNFLKKKGFFIIFRNYRTKMGEIDIIAKDVFGEIIFVEVKTMFIDKHHNYSLIPEDNITYRKLSKMRRMAQIYFGKYASFGCPEDCINNPGFRIDVIAIVLSSRGISRISHYENL